MHTSVDLGDVIFRKVVHAYTALERGSDVTSELLLLLTKLPPIVCIEPILELTYNICILSKKPLVFNSPALIRDFTDEVRMLWTGPQIVAILKLKSETRALSPGVVFM